MRDEIMLYAMKMWEGKPPKGDANDYHASATFELPRIYCLVKIF